MHIILSEIVIFSLLFEYLNLVFKTLLLLMKYLSVIVILSWQHVPPLWLLLRLSFCLWYSIISPSFVWVWIFFPAWSSRREFTSFFKYGKFPSIFSEHCLTSYFLHQELLLEVCSIFSLYLLYFLTSLMRFPSL